MNTELSEVVRLARSCGAMVGVEHLLDTEIIRFTPKELFAFFELAKEQHRKLDAEEFVKLKQALGGSK